MKKNNIIKLGMFSLLLILILVNFVSAEKANMNSFDTEEINIIVSQVSLYDNIIQKYAKKYDVPVTLIKSIIGVETQGLLDYKKAYNNNGEIGLMNLDPFKKNIYDVCLNEGCMNVKLDKSLSLEDKQTQITADYMNPKNSICCGTFILSSLNTQENITFPPTNNCPITRIQKEYSDWQAVLRKYAGENCPSNDNDAYYVERVMQLKSAFDSFENSNVKFYGILRITPSFSIKSPELIDIYSDLKVLIEDLQDEKFEARVQTKLNNFEKDNKVSFGFCEAPEINIINSFYDNLVNAVEFNGTCLYPIANESQFAGIIMQNQILHFNHDVENNFITIVNNLSGDLFKSHTLTVPETFYLPYKDIEIKKNNFLQYNVLGSTVLSNLEKIYFADYVDPLLQKSVSKFVFYKNISGIANYYDSYGSEINITLLNLDICDSTLQYYKTKYFTCMNTTQKKETYNWLTGKWEESAETIKIKFAFALKK